MDFFFQVIIQVWYVIFFFLFKFFKYINKKISLIQHPSTSPYEYDCISNVLTIPSFQTSPSPIRRSNGNIEQTRVVNSSTSHLSSILTNELSPSNSFCVSALSGDIQQPTTTNSNPKMAHLLYFLQTLEYNQYLDNENI